jgi:hypothetical protein
MRLTKECDTCQQEIKIEYDETECTPEYCPFCGSELSVEDGDYDVGIPASESDDWD